jgi:hypothetical protein
MTPAKKAQTIKEQTVVMHAYNPSTWEAEAGGLKVRGLT